MNRPLRTLVKITLIFYLIQTLFMVLLWLDHDNDYFYIIWRIFATSNSIFTPIVLFSILGNEKSDPKEIADKNQKQEFNKQQRW